MNIIWTHHAVKQCWTRMKLSDSDKSMDLFHDKIKDNLENRVKQKDNRYRIPFKVAGQCYIAVGVINHQGFLVVTVMNVNSAKYKKVKKKEWINERVK